jgi:hypothetical protein
MWVACRDLFEKGGLSIEEFDNMTMRRIRRIMKIQEQRLEERQKALEEQRKQQEATSKNLARKQKFK